jgi:hypothetical protein
MKEKMMQNEPTSDKKHVIAAVTLTYTGTSLIYPLTQSGRSPIGIKVLLLVAINIFALQKSQNHLLMTWTANNVITTPTFSDGRKATNVRWTSRIW